MSITSQTKLIVDLHSNANTIKNQLLLTILIRTISYFYSFLQRQVPYETIQPEMVLLGHYQVELE